MCVVKQNVSWTIWDKANGFKSSELFFLAEIKSYGFFSNGTQETMRFSLVFSCCLKMLSVYERSRLFACTNIEKKWNLFMSTWNAAINSVSIKKNQEQTAEFQNKEGRIAALIPCLHHMQTCTYAYLPNQRFEKKWIDEKVNKTTYTGRTSATRDERQSKQPFDDINGE